MNTTDHTVTAPLKVHNISSYSVFLEYICTLFALFSFVYHTIIEKPLWHGNYIYVLHVIMMLNTTQWYKCTVLCISKVKVNLRSKMIAVCVPNSTTVLG